MLDMTYESIEKKDSVVSAGRDQQINRIENPRVELHVYGNLVREGALAISRGRTDCSLHGARTLDIHIEHSKTGSLPHTLYIKIFQGD